MFESYYYWLDCGIADRRIAPYSLINGIRR